MNERELGEFEEVFDGEIPVDKVANDYLLTGTGANQEDDIFFDDDGPNQTQSPARVISPKIKCGIGNGSSGFEGKPSSGTKDNLEDEFFYGINKYLYKRDERSELLPRTGTDFVLLPHNPEFLEPNEGELEPFYIPKQTILEDTLRHEAEKICFQDMLMNRVVYDCVDNTWMTPGVVPSDFGLDALPYLIPKGKDDTTLVFESRFECGNLRRAIQINDFEYNLILKPDYFTRGHTQWYYFSVGNTRRGKEYRFNIINMMKPDSLYNQGMKPLIYSEATARAKKKGWFRDGSDVCYYQNNLKRKNAGFYYTLTFVVRFEHDFDTVYFAHCYPYTFSRLNNFFRTLEQRPNMQAKMRRKILCQTIALNNCEMVIITNFQQTIENSQEKKSVVITSRVHPGETQASFVMEYLIAFLVGSSAEAAILRDKYVFKIVPMLNIDGVVNGNYRCNLAGVDLNRQWQDPSRKLHPTIYHTKQMIKKIREEREIVLFCDIHGHSRKNNIFFYGCSGKDTKKREHVIPLLMSKNCEVFSYKDCSFALQKDREATARIALWRELSIINCYTLEISFSGSDQGKYQFIHFNLPLFREMANTFCQTLVDYGDPDQRKVNAVLEEIDQMILKNQFNNADRGGMGGDALDDEDSDYSNDEVQLENEAAPGKGGNAPLLVGKNDDIMPQMMLKSPQLLEPTPDNAPRERSLNKKKKIVLKKKPQ